MEDLGAVLEAPEIVDPSPDEQVYGVAVDTPEPVEPIAEVKDETDWRKVPENLKTFFKTPEGKAAKDAWFERNAYKEKFPEGIKQVNELTAFLDEHGGREGLTTALGELTGKAAELDGITQKMANGDPSLITDLMDSSPEGFAKLAPIVADQWQKADPEGWSAAMSGVMAATIQSNGIPMFLERMGLMLEVGKTDQIPAMVAQLKEWAQSFQQKAIAPRQQQTQPSKLDAREQSLNQREQQAFNGEMERNVESFRVPTITKELESFAKRRPNEPDLMRLAIRDVKEQVNERLFSDKKYQDSLNGLWARKDRDGAMRLIKSRETIAITEIAPKVGRTIFGNPAAVKTEVAVPVAKTPVVPKSARASDKFDAIWNT